MTITDKLEAILPANGPVTKDERIIEQAVASLSEYDWIAGDLRQSRNYWRKRALRTVKAGYWFIVAAFALGAVIGAFWSSPATATERTFCETIEHVAGATMRARQRGVALSEVIAVAQNADIPEVARLMRTMVIAAYELPRYETAEFQQRAIADFAEEWALACYAGEGQPNQFQPNT